MPKEPKVMTTESLKVWLENMEKAQEMISHRSSIVVPQIPEILKTEELESISQQLDSAKSALSLGTMPKQPTLPEILNTAQLEQIIKALEQANKDSNLKIIEPPVFPKIVATARLVEWIDAVEQANADIATNRINSVEYPKLQDTAGITQWIQDLQRNALAIASCESKKLALDDGLKSLKEKAEIAKESLGINSFELPSSIAEELAKSTIIEFEIGSEERVVANYETIKEKIQEGARKGFALGAESILLLPENFL